MTHDACGVHVRNLGDAMGIICRRKWRRFGSGSPLRSFGILKDLIGSYTHILKISSMGSFGILQYLGVSDGEVSH